MSRAFHIAFEDDWEQSIGFGSYEAATRGHPYEPGDYIRAVERGTAARIGDRL